MSDNKVLPFKPRPRLKVVSPSASTRHELDALLDVYERLVALLRETCDQDLDGLTDSLVTTLVHCKAALNSTDEADKLALIKAMHDELHQIPQVLRALLPGIGPRIAESLEQKLGIQFTRF